MEFPEEVFLYLRISERMFTFSFRIDFLQGGLILAIILVLVYCRSKKLSVLKIFDLMAPGAAIGYGFARIGCHLSVTVIMEFR
ncbi:MAG: prolipoprotein diacylglyceryl transferase [Ignavibacteria bacterium]